MAWGTSRFYSAGENSDWGFRIAIGDKFEGEVVQINKKGTIFVDLAPEMGGPFVRHNSALLLPLDIPEDQDLPRPGDIITAWVKEFTWQGKQVKALLSMFSPRRKPSEALWIGKRVRAKVRSFLGLSAGAWCEVVSEGANLTGRGLLDTKDMAEYHVSDPIDVVRLGEEITCWVDNIGRPNPDDFSLSMLAPRIEGKTPRVGEYRVGAVADVPKDPSFGMWVDIGYARNGWVSPQELESLLRPYRVGDQVEVWVRRVRESKDFALTTIAPEHDARDLRLGQELEGVVKAVDKVDRKAKGAHVYFDVGMVADASVWVPQDAMEDSELNALVGKRMPVWVTGPRKKKQPMPVFVSMEKPEVDAQQVTEGKNFRGKIHRVLEHGRLFVDFGFVQPGVVPVGEVRDYALTSDELFAPEVGQEVDVWVVKVKFSDVILTMLDPHRPIDEPPWADSRWRD
jgi:ribosomal protein S1